MSHIKENIVIEMNKEYLATRVSQKDDGGKLIKYVIKEESNEENNDQHCD